MNAACCVVPSRAGRIRKWFGVGGSVGPGLMLLLLPKCPACVAVYVAVWTSAGLAAPVAGYMRPVLMAIFGLSLIYLVADRLTDRRKGAQLQH